MTPSSDDGRLLAVTGTDSRVAAADHADERLRTESVIWLATVTASGRAHAVPVWFLWDDPTIRLYLMAGTDKLAHLEARPAVALHLDTAAAGDDVVHLHGLAGPTAGRPRAADDEAFRAKYDELLDGDWERWSDHFGVAVTVAVEAVTAWARPEGDLRIETFSNLRPET